MTRGLVWRRDGQMDRKARGGEERRGMWEGSDDGCGRSQMMAVGRVRVWLWLWEGSE